MVLPDETTTGDLLIRRLGRADAEALNAAITANVDHLRPRMAWIAFEPQTVEQRRQLIDGWTAADDYVAGIWLDGALCGSIGLHGDRHWPDGPEIGFWISGDVAGRGITTRAAAALIDLLFSNTDVDAVYLANDVTNLASRRIPEKLGFTHLGTFEVGADGRALAPADTGTDDRWRLGRSDWEQPTP